MILTIKIWWVREIVIIGSQPRWKAKSTGTVVEHLSLINWRKSSCLNHPLGSIVRRKSKQKDLNWKLLKALEKMILPSMLKGKKNGGILIKVLKRSKNCMSRNKRRHLWINYSILNNIKKLRLKMKELKDFWLLGNLETLNNRLINKTIENTHLDLRDSLLQRTTTLNVTPPIILKKFEIIL